MATVAVTRVPQAVYPAAAPYHPAEAFPEYPFAGHTAPAPNAVYPAVRRLFQHLGWDATRHGSPAWNPLGEIIEPGMTVVLKPNFVLSRHRGGKDLFAIITHPSVLRAVADYCWIALRGRGRIIVADAPQYDCDGGELLARTRLEETLAFYRRFPGPRVEWRDLRRYWSRGKHFASLLEPLPGDPEGSLTVNLGARSFLGTLRHPEKLYGAVYNRQETIAHHQGDRQEYEVARTVMNADVVISVPKLKVHKKVGVTLNVKGLVGINTNKNYLVHYSLTPPSRGGDQYPDRLFSPMEEALIRTERWMYDHLLAPRRRGLEFLHRSVYWLHNHTTKRLGLKVAESKRMLDAGNWHGNDSAWRMAADLFRVFLYADRQGQWRDTPQRRTLSIIDGVVGGDVNGPLTPDPVAAGVLLAGANLLAVDLVAARLMGFDPRRMRLYEALLADPHFNYGVASLADIQVRTEEPAWARCVSEPAGRYLGFRPHPGWVGHLEASERASGGEQEPVEKGANTR
jgi:uncharacterized protein (DUF362 family)